MDEGDHVYCEEGPIPVLFQVFYLDFPSPPPFFLLLFAC